MTNKKVTSWTAFPDIEGGSAAIILKEEAARPKGDQLLRRLAADPNNGIAQILDQKQIAKFGGRPDAPHSGSTCSRISP